MKKIIFVMAAFGAFSFGANAQTNRTIKTDMSTEHIKQEKRMGGTIKSAGTVLLNSGSSNMEFQSQPLRVMDVHLWQGYRADGQDAGLLTPEEVIEKTTEWDTSLTNGHCLGCGSGSTTNNLQNKRR